MIAVNLLASERVEALRRRAHRRAWCGVLLGQVSLVGLALLTAAQIQAPREGASLAIVKLQEQLAQKEAERKAITAELAGLRARIDLSKLVTDHPNWGALLAVVAHAKGADAVFERIEIGARNEIQGKETQGRALRGSYSMTLTGYASTRAGVAQVVTRLEATGVFDSVVPVETRATTYGPASVEAVSFSLALTLSEGGKAR